MQSAKNIFIKKQTILSKEEIIQYLNKKGYMSEVISEIEEEQ